jgi:hypothetical protein
MKQVIRSMSITKRISRTATICLNANIGEVFQLFGPVREKDWAFGWNPEVLYSGSPLVEEKMIFRTPGVDGDYIWTVSKYDEGLHLVEYTVHTENRLWFITVQCRKDGERTLATVTYTYTSLTQAGIALNQNALEDIFRLGLKDWEEAINHYLLFGQLLHPEHA